METQDSEKQTTSCQNYNFNCVNVDDVLVYSREQIGSLVQSPTKAMEIDLQVEAICTSNNERNESLSAASASETDLPYIDSSFSEFNAAANNNHSTLETGTDLNDEAGNLVDTSASTMETILPQIESVFSEYNTDGDGVFTALEAIANDVQVEMLSEACLSEAEVKSPQIEANPACNTLETSTMLDGKLDEILMTDVKLPQITSIYGAYNEVNNCVFSLLDDASPSNNGEVGILLETLPPVIETVLPQIEAVYSECNTAKDNDLNEAQAEKILNSDEAAMQAMRSKPAQLQANFDQYDEVNPTVFSSLSSVCLSNSEDVEITPAVKTVLPQIEVVYSEHDAVNCCDVKVEAGKTSSREDTGGISTQATQIESAQTKAVLSDCDITGDEVLDKLDGISTTNNEKVEVKEMEIEMPKISSVHSECDPSIDNVFSDTGTDMNAGNRAVTDTAQPQRLKTVSSKLEDVLALDNVQITTQITQSETESYCDVSDCNMHEKDSLCDVENERESSNQVVTQAMDIEIAAIDDECIASNELPLKSTIKAAEHETTIDDPQTNNACDSLKSAKTQEGSVLLDTMHNESISEAWKPIPIKKEIIDVDEEVNVNNLHLNASIKTEFHIKIEELDIKDTTMVSKRDFKCKKCQKNFYLECIYRLHMLLHKSKKPIHCDECSFKCHKRKKMLIHLRKHTGEKRILCKICKEGYYFFNVVEHFQKCPKLKKYNCGECEYSTGQKFYYERHMRLHTGERLKCFQCDSYFLDNVARKKHSKCHTKQKPYQCHICYRKFKQKGARERHILAYCDRRCPKCEYVSIYCTDFYDHVTEAHPFTKLKIRLRQYYRAYENMKQRLERQVLSNSDDVDPLSIEPEYETRQNMEGNLSYLADTKFIKCEALQDSHQKAEPNVGCEMEQNVECALNETSESKAKWNTDYELIQNIKYELVEGTESCMHNANYEAMNFCNDYESMQNVKWDSTKDSSDSIENEMEENIDYDLIQNVNCELTEGSDDYTLLCL